MIKTNLMELSGDKKLEGPCMKDSGLDTREMGLEDGLEWREIITLGSLGTITDKDKGNT